MSKARQRKMQKQFERKQKNAKKTRRRKSWLIATACIAGFIVAGVPAIALIVR